MNASILQRLVNPDKDTETNWVRLEQEYIPSTTGETSLGDLNNMMSYVLDGKSARTYIMDACSYLVVSETQFIVTLKFYVWPSAMDLSYRLTADYGEVSIPITEALFREKDVLFNGTDEVDIGYLFSGTLTPSMPFVELDGSVGLYPDVTIEDHIVLLSRRGHCVYRALGNAHGYSHNVVMTFDKLDENGNPVSITNLQNNIFAEWTSPDGETQTTSMQLKIPKCVEDALATCADGSMLYDIIKCAGEYCNGMPLLIVYYNTCKEDDVLGTRWTVNE